MAKGQAAIDGSLVESAPIRGGVSSAHRLDLHVSVLEQPFVVLLQQHGPGRIRWDAIKTPPRYT